MEDSRKMLTFAALTLLILLENSKKSLRYAEIYTNLAKLVFGGIIIGGVFEDMQHPVYLYGMGLTGFFTLIWIGTKYYNKGIKEK